MKRYKKEGFKGKFRTNERIKVKKLRVISPDGEQLGILDREEALEKARDYGLDLIEVAPKAVPPVCRIADFGKMQYEQSKKEKQQRKNQNKVIKTIQIKPNIGENDLNRKISDIQKFINKNYRVVVQVIMKGRQRRHTKLVEDQTINKVQESLTNALMETPQYQGNRITVVFSRDAEIISDT